MTPPQVKIDPEFQSLIPPLSEKEFELLEQSILKDGCRDALILWAGHDIIVDGHNRYAICSKHSVPFRTIQMDFSSRENVQVWMILNQLGRRNLPEAMRVKLALQLKPMLAEQAEKRRLANLKRGNEKPDLPKWAERGDTREVLAEKAGISKTKFSKAEHVLTHAPAYIQKMYEDGDLTAHRAYQLTKRLDGCTPSVVDIATRYKVPYPDTIGILTRLEISSQKQDSNGTFQSIWDTGTIQPGDELEAVHITAHPRDLEDAIATIRRAHIKLSYDVKTWEAQTLPDGVYNVLYVDGTDVDLKDHYGFPDRINLKVADNAALFVWVTPATLLKGLGLLSAWQFNYQTQFTWVLPESETMPSPMFIKERHLILLMGTRGTFKPLDVFSASTVSSLVQWPPGESSTRHSSSCQLIEKLYPKCSYLTLLFAGEWTTREGWTCSGPAHKEKEKTDGKN